MALFVRQVLTLTLKNLLVAFIRRWFSTTLRAFFLPVVFVGFLSYARFLFIPPSVYGIGEATPIRGLSEALSLVSGGRDKLVFVNNGFSDGSIQSVIDRVANNTGSFGSQVEILSQEEELLTVCRNSIRGTSTCIAGAVFFSSPSEGEAGRWNYTIRADGGLQTKIMTDSSENDAEIYLLPLQHAIDRAISEVEASSDSGRVLPQTAEEYPYTSMTKEERLRQIRTRYMGGIIDILAVAFFIEIVGVTYQLTGVIASERENGMAQLLDCMMPNRKRWQPQMARIIANHLAFDVLYGPGWVIMAIILSVGVFSKTSAAIVIIFNILSGLSMSSLSIFGGAFFKKAQLSGITSVIASLLLAIIAQVASKAGTASVAILSLLFPPMNYVYFTIFMARWERQDLATNLVKRAPENTSALPGIAFWIFSIIQIVVFPVLGAYVERTLYGTASSNRTTTYSDAHTAVSLHGFTKEYPPSRLAPLRAIFTRKRLTTVLAVDDLSLNATTGQIMVLLGANGSGKSTTLDSIAGLTSITSGDITVNYPEPDTGLGFCPQKNVLWDDLTVEEHVRIFNRVKSLRPSSKDENLQLLASCDIDRKASARSKTLSGGQRRKLQLAMMFTGGSRVCCVDEVSSGLDPLSRRKIWDILLAERGSRSIILTTHFLDEAELLADYIAILSKGTLKASGTSVELKHKLGSGYRVHVYKTHGSQHLPTFKDTSYVQRDDQTIYSLTDSAKAADFLGRIESEGFAEYQVNGPTIEDVFLKVAEEVKSDSDPTEKTATGHVLQEVGSHGRGDFDGDEVAKVVVENNSPAQPPQLLDGRRISMPRQALVLFSKRWVVLRRNTLPYLAALLIPIIASGLVTLFLKNFQKAGCSPASSALVSDIISLSTQIDYQLVAGPRNRLGADAIQLLASTLAGSTGVAGVAANTTKLLESVNLVDSLAEFDNYINNHYANVTPGGFYLGDESSPPTFAWRGNGDIAFPVIIQNAMDTLLSNVSISNQYQAFDVPWGADVGKALQLITYFGLAMAVYPSFFALYPTIERLRNVRGLHYSNGVRSAPLWLAYTTFDFTIVLLASAVAIIIFRAVSDVWYHIEYLFVVFFLYGLSSTLLSYVISLFSRSQLAAFAFAAGGQAVMFLLYFIAYMSVLTYSPIDKIDTNVNICHFTIAAISPVANLTRALFVTLNVFSITCRGRQFASYAGSMTTFGGPILYLILQTFFLFLLLLWWDSGPLFRHLRGKKQQEQVEENDTVEAEVSNELTRVNSSQDGLRVLNLTITFGKTLAVNNVTFGVPRSEVFALLGPNGAGKSTTISLIRGDIQPSRRGGDILVDGISVISHRAQARSRLGVCPQFDAMDTMTVAEHLHFYAKVRGVSDPRHNVEAVMRAVGLKQYADRMAAKLSGGNKRKLSLGIALMGNPSVLLLDEPSSGMDAASKRVMWKTLESVVPGRSLVLTTHSMEEADALATRAGIMAGRMLALGTTDYLRRKHGDAYYVHVVHRQAPHASEEDMQRIRDWVLDNFPDASIESKVYAGQIRFSVPTKGFLPSKDGGEITGGSGISSLFTALEKNKSGLQIEYYSVSRATLDQVFLNIVTKHNVEEEGGETVTAPRTSLLKELSRVSSRFANQ
ncbi:ABC transporter domain containing protein [Cladophialophora carrionii]|uniref:ABC transporter domain containing protein n=1 Tax=Cladophialophora carrionii TaxID=86049 RepID=A0A1C1CBF1_9EURO|nr:ABC transporter domain containing protein [Cladophialophora carrionii]